MFVDEVIVRLSLLYDLLNVLAGVSPPFGANNIEGFGGDLQNVVLPKDCSLLSDMSQRYNSNVDFSETQIIIWEE